ncbi:MBL fold metallo-hydrolase [Natroniella sulfidigena]|uniref:MBL fold metallo-hydrolase n=1 Tax=Natroniella sulfidigena TaxID=723921 RepID=UPI002009F879|nr:MBL fold metallo-hydrolase [Natroniella sulfidigena]MCK8815818.1 MBL fold metallo-hydrolase [Natroniella sulfidigena]
MKLTVLGNRSPYPTKDAACSGYLLQSGEQKILIDVGPGTLSNLQQIIPFYQLDAIIISHLHQDHCLDLLPMHYGMAKSIEQGKREEALAVYLPFDGGDELQFIQAKVGDEFHLQQITQETELKLENLKVSFQRSNHPKECYAIKVDDGAKQFVYTADTGWDESLVEFAMNVDLLLAEASLLEKDSQYTKAGHLTVKQATQLGIEAQVGKVLLTHFWPEYEQSQVAAEIPEAEIEVELARVLEEYSF